MFPRCDTKMLTEVTQRVYLINFFLSSIVCRLFWLIPLSDEPILQLSFFLALRLTVSKVIH